VRYYILTQSHKVLEKYYIPIDYALGFRVFV